MDLMQRMMHPSIPKELVQKEPPETRFLSDRSEHKETNFFDKWSSSS
jgi:hypothetical protein